MVGVNCIGEMQTKLISNQFRANRAFWHLSTIQYLLTMERTIDSNIPSSKMRSICLLVLDGRASADARLRFIYEVYWRDCPIWVNRAETSLSHILMKFILKLHCILMHPRVDNGFTWIWAHFDKNEHFI